MLTGLSWIALKDGEGIQLGRAEMAVRGALVGKEGARYSTDRYAQLKRDMAMCARRPKNNAEREFLDIIRKTDFFSRPGALTYVAGLDETEPRVCDRR